MNKGFPHKERKKAKTKLPEDKRPHIHQPSTWWRSEEAKDERAFYIPHIKIIKNRSRWDDNAKMDVWSTQEAHTLIDMWAEISWGRHSDHHKNMSKLVRYFKKLWIKQRGNCAITNLPLHGAPGCLGHGIGIDIINHDFGIRKGNVRLVSAPIAATRYYYPQWRTQQVDMINPENYKEWPVFWAILKHIQWWLLKEKPFRWLPIKVVFPKPKLTKPDERLSTWIDFQWQTFYPGDDTITAWKALRSKNYHYCGINLRDDRIHVSYANTSVGYGYNPCKTMYDWAATDYKMPLCDPTLHFESQVAKAAMTGFVGSLQKFLRELA